MPQLLHAETPKSSPVPTPISLLLPLPDSYASASMKALIFLAIEGNPSLSTEAAIAAEISKLTDGEITPSQSCISKHLRPMKQRNIYARGNIWKLEKFEEHYRLIGQEEVRRHNAIQFLSMIPFDRSTVFQNSRFSPSTFGFRFKSTANITSDHISIATDFFKNLLDGQYFHILVHENVLYILLDLNNRHYSNAVKLLQEFIETDFLIHSSR